MLIKTFIFDYFIENYIISILNSQPDFNLDFNDLASRLI